MDFLHGSHQQTQNTDLAAAICTLGIPRNAEQPLQVLVGDINQVIFFFGEESPCGLYKTCDCMQLWDDPALDVSRPRHAITYIRSAMRSRSRLLDYAKAKIKVGIAAREGGRFEIVSLRPDHPKPPRPAGPAPDPSTTPRLQTDDIELAASLLSCGIPLWKTFPIERHPDSRISFFFQPHSPCGLFNTRELMVAWQDHTWHERHSEHPLAYLWCAFENRRRLLREIKFKNPTISLIRAGYPQFLTMNSDPKVEKTFMEALKNL